MTKVDEALAAIAGLDGPIKRLAASRADDANLFPLTTTEASSDVAKALDAFLQRFQQVYDLTARKAMPLTLAALTSDHRQRSFRDMLDELERLGAFESADQWTDLNDLRNHLIHEYAMSDAERTMALNSAWEAAPLLITQAGQLFDLLKGTRND